MTPLFRFVTRHVFLAVLLALVALALVLTAARLFTSPLVARYTDHIAALATERLGQPVTIGRLSARWRGIGPVLVLRDVTFWRPDRSGPALQLNEIDVDFGAADMLTSGYLAPGRITVRGVRLTVIRHPDGSLSVLGIGRRGGDISALLLGPTRARLLDARLEWIDNLRQRPPVMLEAADILMRNDGERHQLDADFSVEGRRVSLRADLAGHRTGRLADWHGKIYLRAEELRLPSLLAAEIPTDYQLRSGSGDVELWGEWAAGRIHSLEGEARLRNIRLAGASGAMFDVESLAGRFDWRREGGGWRLDVDDLALRRTGRNRPATRVSLAIRSGSSTAESWQLRADHVDLADLVAASAIRLPRGGLLADLLATRPRGEIHDLDLRLRPRAGVVFSLSAGVRKLRMASYGRLPMLDNFSGSVRATNNGGRLMLATRDAAIHPARLFRWPIPLERLDGEVRWQRHNGAWQFSAETIDAVNRHIETRTRLRLDLGNEDSRFLDLQTDFRNGIATYAPHYFPAGIMPPRLVEWLDRSITTGHVTRGSCIVRGPLRDFPFHRTHSGHFEVVFGVDGAFLDYREDWPPLLDIVAQVRFHNNSLQVSGTSARMYESRLSGLEARIESLKPTAPLRIRGQAQGPLEDVIRLLRETPLRKTYGPLVERMSATGESSLELGLAIPLRQGESELEIDGTLDFDNNSLRNTALGLDLDGITGPLEISPNGLGSRRLAAVVAGNRLAASVAPARAGTRIHASGRLDTRSIKGAYPAVAALPLDGTSDWDLAITLPPPNRLASGEKAIIQASSELEGTQVYLPLGLGKPAQSRRPFETRIELGRQGIGNVSMRFGDLSLAGQPGTDGWRARVDSPVAVGQILFPQPGGRQPPVKADFDQLSVILEPGRLPGDSAPPRPAVDPAGFPELDLGVREVLINGSPYGKLTARTRRTPEGIRMEEMRLSSSDGELGLSGYWTSTGSSQQTGLNLGLRTGDLGRTLRDLAISQAVAGGKGQIEAEVKWQGSPLDIRRETLSGQVRFRADDGRFDEAEPGVGRLFGLLNVGALQRRLRLDFSDLFRQGLSFEKIEGQFTIENGVARTDDTEITGPAGDIRIEGLTDLTSGRMEQDVYVVPAISGAVALAGGIAAGPLVGAALLAAGKGIDRLATVHYRMTGPWSDPEVERAPTREDDSELPGSGLPEIH